MKKVSVWESVEILFLSLTGGLIAATISIGALLAIQLIIVGAVNKIGLLIVGIIAGTIGLPFTNYMFINEMIEEKLEEE